MNIQLIMSENCPHCAEAEKIWRDICDNKPHAIQVMKQGQVEANQIIETMSIKTFPVLIIDSEIKAVGHPTIETAKRFFSEHLGN